VKLQRLIDPGHVYLQLEATDVSSAVEAVATRLSADSGLPSTEIVRGLLERERLGSTSVGGGFAIPHCKLPGLKGIIIALASFVDGVDFGAEDGQLASFLFVVLSPPDHPAAHLQVLSQIARVLKRGELRARLRAARDGAEVTSAIEAVAEAEGL